MTNQSWAAEVIADASGKWIGNQCRFASEQEAKTYVADLAWRWTSVTDTRVVPSDDPVNCRWNYDSGQLDHFRDPPG